MSLLSRLLRRAARAEEPVIPASVLVKAADALDQSEIQLEAIAQAFANNYEYRRARPKAQVLTIGRGDGSFQPPEETLRIVPAFIKAWLRERNLTAAFSMDLCHRLLDYLVCDAEPLRSGESIKTDEVVQRDAENRDATGMLKRIRESSQRQRS